jgi:hypothetical protein
MPELSRAVSATNSGLARIAGTCSLREPVACGRTRPFVIESDSNLGEVFLGEGILDPEAEGHCLGDLSAEHVELIPED